MVKSVADMEFISNGAQKNSAVSLQFNQIIISWNTINTPFWFGVNELHQAYHLVIYKLNGNIELMNCTKFWFLQSTVYSVLSQFLWKKPKTGKSLFSHRTWEKYWDTVYSLFMMQKLTSISKRYSLFHGAAWEPKSVKHLHVSEWDYLWLVSC